MNKNVERGRATRAHVVEVATRLFAEHGYDGTSIEAVQASAGVSRGSLYHHFPGKEALFWAVLEEVGARVTRQGEDIARDAPDPVALQRAGAQACIRMAGDPGSVAPGRVAPPVSSPERVWHRIGKVLRGGREEQT